MRSALVEPFGERVHELVQRDGVDPQSEAAPHEGLLPRWLRGADDETHSSTFAFAFWPGLVGLRLVTP